MLELQTSLYRELLRPPCSECDEGPGDACDRPVGLDRDGHEVERSEGAGLVVSWPACPHRWAGLRRLGGELVSLPTALSWALERGVHRRRRLAAPVAQLLRHYLAVRETPGVLKSRRDRSDAELERRAREAAGGRGR